VSSAMNWRIIAPRDDRCRDLGHYGIGNGRSVV
jgi:hypothetical protein